jgi:hypothetical protein
MAWSPGAIDEEDKRTAVLVPLLSGGPVCDEEEGKWSEQFQSAHPGMEAVFSYL